MRTRSARSRGASLALALLALGAGGTFRAAAAADGPAVRATAGALSVHLSWESEGAGTPWGYNVYRLPGGILGVPERVNLLPLPGGRGGSLVDAEVADGVRYAYRVTALDERGSESFLPGYATARGTALPGDADGVSNGDGLLRVDGLDILRVHASFGRSEGEPGFDARCDLDGDGTVDGIDLDAVARNYGRTAPARW